MNEVETIAIWLWKASQMFDSWNAWNHVPEIQKSAFRRMARALIAEGFCPSV